QEISVRAQVAELVPAVEAAESGLLGGVGVERKGGLVRGEVRRLAALEDTRVRLQLGRAWMGEERRQAAPDVSAARDRAEVVDVWKNAEPRQRLEHAEIERGRANSAARQREADGPEAGVVGDLFTRSRELAALRDVCALRRENGRKGLDDLSRRACPPGKSQQRPHEGDG